MEIVFPANKIILYVMAAAFLVVCLSALLKRGPLWRRLAPIGLLALVGGGLSIFLYRDTHLRITDAGLSVDTYGTTRVVWQDVERAVYVPRVDSSQWAPKAKVGGVGIGDWRAGWFLLAGGEKAFVTMQTLSQALMLRAKGTTYLFAPADFNPFLAEVRRHVKVEVP